MKDIIIELEDKIKNAQLHNDVKVLEELLAQDLKFIRLDGNIATKLDDLNAHKAKLVLFKDITFSERTIHEFDDFAVVTVRAEIQGETGGSAFHGHYRYLRNWARINHKWQVISGCVAEIKQ